MTTLILHSSIRGEDSISRSLCKQLGQRFAQQGEVIIERDLTQEMAFVCASSFNACTIPKTERSVDQNQHPTVQLADALILELLSATTLIVGSPLYNFGPPASLKAWADLVARAGTTFEYTQQGPQGLLTCQQAYIIGVSGGTKMGGDMDFNSNWLTFFLHFLGIEKIETIIADGVFGQDGAEKVAAARHAIAALQLSKTR